MPAPSDPFTFNPIGIIHSCYIEKFGIPRQSGLVKSATATLELFSPFNHPDALRGMDGLSHLWIVFLFHKTSDASWKATVRPPRLGGNQRIGVFASRSNFRPNSIGLSVVELLHIQGSTLHLGGGDFLDQTPVLDIKPYLPYADCIPEATYPLANRPPEAKNTVTFSPEAQIAVQTLENKQRPALRQLIIDLLTYNPQPAYLMNDPKRVFGTRIFDLDLQWAQTEENITVQKLEVSTPFKIELPL